MNKNIYSTRNDVNYGEVLLKNGNESYCPFSTALTVPQQSNMGQVNFSIIRFPCSTNCPHATIIENEDGTKSYLIGCTHTETIFELQEKEKEGLTIIT